MLRQVEVGSSCPCLTDTATYKMNKNESVFAKAKKIMSQRSMKIDRAPPNRNEGAQCIFKRAREMLEEGRRRKEIENTRSAENGRRIVQKEEAIKRRSGSVNKETAPAPSTLPAKTCTPSGTKQGLNSKPVKTSPEYS